MKTRETSAGASLLTLSAATGRIEKSTRREVTSFFKLTCQAISDYLFPPTKTYGWEH
jgi:hypothetical protein